MKPAALPGVVEGPDAGLQPWCIFLWGFLCAFRAEVPLGCFVRLPRSCRTRTCAIYTHSYIMCHCPSPADGIVQSLLDLEGAVRVSVSVGARDLILASCRRDPPHRYTPVGKF